MPKKLNLDRDFVLQCTQRHMTAHEIAVLLGVSSEGLRRAMVRDGLERTGRRKKNPKKGNHGERNPAWKGGRSVDKSGYILVHSPNHPFAGKRSKKVREHRLVMERKLGRFLSPNEVVHHIDGDPSNNHPDNLVLFVKNADHLSKTIRGRVPNWTASGVNRMQQGSLLKSLRAETSREALETYAQKHNVSSRHLLRRLSPDNRNLLKMALSLGIFEPLPLIMSKRAEIEIAYKALPLEKRAVLWRQK
jgi:HNH endonuclease